MGPMKMHAYILIVVGITLFGLNVASATRGCPVNKGVCNRYCLSRGFGKGKCFFDDCRCRRGFPAVADFEEKIGCPNDDLSCRHFCFDLGLMWDSGYCSGLLCYCKSTGPLTLPDRFQFCPGPAFKCNKFCANIGFTYGHCKEEKCTCFNKPANSELTFPSNRFGCPDSHDNCSKNCVNFGFQRGYCDTDRCSCYNHPITGPLRIPHYAYCPGPKYSCETYCKGLGYVTGYCESTTCACFPKNSNSFRYSTCNDDIRCAKACVNSGRMSGFCHPIACACFSDSTKNKMLRLPENRFGCPQNGHGKFECLINCLSLNFQEGYCQGNQCECHLKHESGGWALPPKKAGCPNDSLECLYHCMIAGFRNGYCYKNSCTCNHSDPELPTSAITCNDELQCLGRCVVRGYVTGTCFKGDQDNSKCHCSSLTNDLD